MPHKTHAARVPSTAKTVTRSGTTAAGSTLYTVPAGKTLVVLDAWVSITSAGAAGSGVINVPSEDDASTQAIVGTNANTANGVGFNTIGCEARVPAAGTVVAVGSGLTLFNYGFSGYLESA